MFGRSRSSGMMGGTRHRSFAVRAVLPARRAVAGAHYKRMPFPASSARIGSAASCTEFREGTQRQFSVAAQDRAGASAPVWMRSTRDRRARTEQPDGGNRIPRQRRSAPGPDAQLVHSTGETDPGASLLEASLSSRRLVFVERAIHPQSGQNYRRCSRPGSGRSWPPRVSSPRCIFRQLSDGREGLPRLMRRLTFTGGWPRQHLTAC